MNTQIKLILGAILGVFLLSLAGCGIEIVDTGYRGVKTTFGEVEPKSLPEGFYMFNPITSNIIEMDARVQRGDYKATAYTKDVQTATVVLTVNYRMDPNRAHLLYQRVGTEWDKRLVPQVIQSSVKNEFGKWDAVDVVANRSQIQMKIEGAIRDNLGKKDVDVESVQISNIDYSGEFERAVERKVVAVQNAIAEKNRTIQVEEKGKQTVISANAEAESMRIRANALEANPKLVDWAAVEKWDGKLPVYQLGGATPFINIK